MFTAKATDKEAACVAELKKQFQPSLLNEVDRDFLNDNTYLRFARARKADAHKAAEMLKAAIQWRNDTKPYAITEEEVHETAKHVTVVCGGYSKDGCPILVLSVVEPAGLTMEARKQFLSYMLEETQRKGYDRITWIVTWGHLSKDKEVKEDKDPDAKKNRKEALQIIQNYYPERMNLFLLFHAPFLVKMLLPFASMIISSVTASKVHNLGSDVKYLDKYIARDELPQICEGTKPDVVLECFSDLPSLIEPTKHL